jgi:hypothetical protein
MFFVLLASTRNGMMYTAYFILNVRYFSQYHLMILLGVMSRPLTIFPLISRPRSSAFGWMNTVPHYTTMPSKSSDSASKITTRKHVISCRSAQ